MKLILLFLLTLSVRSLNDSVEEKIILLMKKIEKLEKEVNELRQWKENELNKNKYNIKSDIIKEKEFIDLLYNRLEQNLYIKHKHFHLERIYTSEKDGKFLEDLYKKCDKQKMILLVIENMAGYKFGGFIQEFIVNDENKDYIDHFNQNNEDFIFSIDNNRIYNPTFFYDVSSPPKNNDGHLNIYKSYIDFHAAFRLVEKNDNNLLEGCMCEISSHGLLYWGGYRPFIRDIDLERTGAKIVEAFQVIFDLNE